MFITKKHISRRTVLKGAGVSLALPFLDAMVPAGHGACANRRGAEDAHGLLLYSPRRDHAQHRARPGHG